MAKDITDAEQLKFRLLAEGLAISADAQAYIDEANGGRAMTPADYASTSGVILELDDDVWVNAPIADHNANFVTTPDYTLDLEEGELVVTSQELRSTARFWLPPAYHGECNATGEPYNSYAFTHSDRVRISPIEGCAFTCKFCDLPYEFRYRNKRIDGLLDAVAVAANDSIQPARHVLISGGTPRPADYDYVHEVYERVIEEFPALPIDIMMVPLDEVVDVRRLGELGVNELSINIEIFNRDLARRMMRRKSDQGLDHYLAFLADAADALGPGRVRSMLLVGLESMDDTLDGVSAIAERGCVPVLSPFRPDPATPLSDMTPPTAAFLEETYLRARDVAAAHDVPLGPGCIPCSHNTLTLAGTGAGTATYEHARPHLV
jgi:hypothetical protein